MAETANPGCSFVNEDLDQEGIDYTSHSHILCSCRHQVCLKCSFCLPCTVPMSAWRLSSNLLLMERINFAAEPPGAKWNREVDHSLVWDLVSCGGAHFRSQSDVWCLVCLKNMTRILEFKSEEIKRRSSSTSDPLYNLHSSFRLSLYCWMLFRDRGLMITCGIALLM